MNAQSVRLMVLACLGLVLCLPASGEVILDDDFEGGALDTHVWEYSYSSTGTVSVSDGRLHFEPGAAIDAYDTFGLNYVNMTVYGVEGSGWGFGLIGALDGSMSLGVRTAYETTLHFRWAPGFPPDPLHTTSGDETIDLGVSSDGDYEIIWTPNLLEVRNNDDILFSRDDPAAIPYYYAMGPFTMATGYGGVSLDRVVIWTPEPATLSLLVLGSLLLHRSRKRRRR